MLSELDYLVLIHHYCRLQALERARLLFVEMGRRGLPASTLAHALMLHYSASLDLNTGRTRRTRLKQLQKLAWRQAHATQDGSSPPSIRVPIPLLATAVYPYADALFASILFTDQGALRKGLGWTEEVRAQHARLSLTCFQLLQAERMLDAHDASHVHLRLMRLLLGSRMYLPCRSVYASMAALGMRETAEGYRLLMTSLVNEVEDSTSSDAANEEGGEDSDSVVWRKRQLVKLKLMTLAQQMTRNRVPLTADHFHLLIHAACRVHDVKHAFRYREQMKAMGVACPTAVHHALLSLPLLDASLRDGIIEDMKQGWGVDVTAFRLLVQDGVRRKDLGAVVAFLRQWHQNDWKTARRKLQTSAAGPKPTVHVLDVTLPLYSEAMQAAEELGLPDTVQQLIQACWARHRIRLQPPSATAPPPAHVSNTPHEAKVSEEQHTHTTLAKGKQQEQVEAKQEAKSQQQQKHVSARIGSSSSTPPRGLYARSHRQAIP